MATLSFYSSSDYVPKDTVFEYFIITDHLCSDDNDNILKSTLNIGVDDFEVLKHVRKDGIARLADSVASFELHFLNCKDILIKIVLGVLPKKTSRHNSPGNPHLISNFI